MAADYLIIPDLKQKATGYLVSLVSVSNCVPMNDFAVYCNCVELQLVCNDNDPGQLCTGFKRNGVSRNKL